MEGCFMFQWVFVFQMGGASFLSGGHPMGGISFDGGGVSKKNRMVGGVPHAPPLWETLHRGGVGMGMGGAPPLYDFFENPTPHT